MTEIYQHHNFYLKNTFKNLFDIIKLCFVPFSIFSPIPFFCISIFLIASDFSELSHSSINQLAIGVLLTLVSSGASNFWNHANDVEEDIKNNKYTLFTDNIISQNKGILISIFLYGISIIIAFYESINLNRPILPFFLIWAFITWWYSDSIYLKKIFKIRLKTHYIGELLTYSIAYSMYTMSIWLIFSDSIIKGLILSLIFLCFGTAGVMLKDLKDIEGDREAGLKTLGVMFSPSILIKVSCIFLILYFIIIILATYFGVFKLMTIIILIPLTILLKNTFFHFQAKNWILEIKDIKNIKSMVFSTYSSLIILGFTNFF